MSSKYDFVKVKVVRSQRAPSAISVTTPSSPAVTSSPPLSHYYILSRFAIAKVLSFSGLPDSVAQRIAMQLKKTLVDEGHLELDDERLRQELAVLMTNSGPEVGPQHIRYVNLLTTLNYRRLPVVVMVNGAPQSGKGQLARRLMGRLNGNHVADVDVLWDVLSPIIPKTETTPSATGENAAHRKWLASEWLLALRQLVVPSADVLTASGLTPDGYHPVATAASAERDNNITSNVPSRSNDRRGGLPVWLLDVIWDEFVSRCDLLEAVACRDILDHTAKGKTMAVVGSYLFLPRLMRRLAVDRAAAALSTAPSDPENFIVIPYFVEHSDHQRRAWLRASLQVKGGRRRDLHDTSSRLTAAARLDDDANILCALARFIQERLQLANRSQSETSSTSPPMREVQATWLSGGESLDSVVDKMHQDVLTEIERALSSSPCSADDATTLSSSAQVVAVSSPNYSLQ